MQNEIISHFIEQEYLDPMDDAVIDDLVQEFRRRGLDPEALDSAKIFTSASSRLGLYESMEPREMRSRPSVVARKPAEGSTSAPGHWPAVF